MNRSYNLTPNVRPDSNALRRRWQAQIDHAMAQLAALDRFGEDEYENGSIISFQYQFVVGGQIYDYAAIKCEGRWFSTGPRAPKAYTWEEMLYWWLDSHCDINLHYVTKLEPA